MSARAALTSAALAAAMATTALAAGTSPVRAQGPDAPGTPPATALHCTGNEPFWSLDLSPGTAILKRPAGEAVESTTFTGTLDSLAYLDPPWHVWRGTVASGTDVAAPLVALVHEEACRDTMKGDLRDARAIVSLPGGGTVTGCCTLGGPLIQPTAATAEDVPFADYGTKAMDDWSRVLPDLLPAIQACVAAAPDPVDRVLKGWPMNRGMIGTRLRTRDGAVIDCTATTGGRVDEVRAVPAEADPLPGQGEPVFLPARARAPSPACGQVERVSGPQGEAAAGYLLYDAGCG